MRKNILIVAIFLCYASMTFADGLLYQWVDKNGVRHFSNVPPPDYAKGGITPKITYEIQHDAEAHQQAQAERLQRDNQIESERAYKRQQQISADIRANEEHQRRMSDIENRQRANYQKQERIENFRKAKNDLESEVSKLHNIQLDRQVNETLNNELETMKQESSSQTDARRAKQREKAKEWETENKQRNMEWEAERNRSKQRDIEWKVDSLEREIRHERNINTLRSY